MASRFLASVILASFAITAASARQAAPAGVETFKIDPNHSEADFKVRHLITHVTGKVPVNGTIVMNTADLTKSTVDVVIDPAALTTGVDARDKDLRSSRFFDVATYPTITFKSSSVAAPAKGQLQVTGTLTMHGVAKTIVIPVTFNGTGPGMKPGTVVAGFDGQVKLDRTDFGLKTLASELLDSGVVGKEVDIDLNIEADKQ
jgi:polyisoprenoid-binding protein YceI